MAGLSAAHTEAPASILLWKTNLCWNAALPACQHRNVTTETNIRQRNQQCMTSFDQNFKVTEICSIKKKTCTSGLNTFLNINIFVINHLLCKDIVEWYSVCTLWYLGFSFASFGTQAGHTYMLVYVSPFSTRHLGETFLHQSWTEAFSENTWGGKLVVPWESSYSIRTV